MKTLSLLTVPLVALLLAGCPDRSQPQDTPAPRPPTLSDRVDHAVDRTRDAASDAKAALDAKLTDWDLTPTEIETDLKKSGRIVREKAAAAGEKTSGVFDNARLVTVINGKYVADNQLSALKIDVDADAGVITLTGNVGTAELAGRAVALALDTEGVSRVIGVLKVDSVTGPAAPAADSTM